MSRWLQRLQRRLFGRRAVAVFAVAAMLLAVCSVQRSHARVEDEFRSAEHSHSVAKSSAVKRSSAVVDKRVLLPGQPVLLSQRDQVPAPRIALRPREHRAVSLPPARMRYRRTVHDDHGDPPA